MFSSNDVKLLEQIITRSLDKSEPLNTVFTNYKPLLKNRNHSFDKIGKFTQQSLSASSLKEHRKLEDFVSVMSAFLFFLLGGSQIGIVTLNSPCTGMQADPLPFARIKVLDKRCPLISQNLPFLLI